MSENGATPSRCPGHRRFRQSALPLLVAGILAHDEDDATATNNLALVANATNAGANLHTCVVAAAAHAFSGIWEV